MKYLEKFDPEIFNLIEKELLRQRDGLEMIPSENFPSLEVLQALGSIVTNKYSEGYPGKRYYGGCEYIDQIETLAINRAKKLFKADHANVQPLSGAPANLAAYSALLKPGDTILGMDLSHGGHLTHGHPVTFTAKIYNFIRYKTDEQGNIDYENILKLAKLYKPNLILVGYSSYSREIDYQKIKEIADTVNSLTMADIAHIAGLIAAGEMNNPVPYFDIVTTTTHKTLRGPRGGMILCKEKHAQAVDKAVFPGLQGGPHQNVIAAKAVAFKEAITPAFKQYAKHVKKNAKVLENKLNSFGFNIMFKGTENHLLLINMANKGLTGKITQDCLSKAGITVNKNIIPDDPRSPMDPSGIRLGTPAITTRGMKENEMEIISELINDAVNNYKNDKMLAKIKSKVKNLCDKFPLYPELN